jgi:hypothetical protein
MISFATDSNLEADFIIGTQVVNSTTMAPIFIKANLYERYHTELKIQHCIHFQIPKYPYLEVAGSSSKNYNTFCLNQVPLL